MLKRLAVGLFLLCGLMLPAKASINAPDISCDQKAIYDAATNGKTELVALITGTRIYVCGFTIRTGATGVGVRLIYGTGTACATGTTSVTPVFTLTSYDGLVEASGDYRGMKTPNSNALCIETDNGVAVDAIVYYAQF